MFCINCGSKLQIQGQKYCGGCGSKQDADLNSDHKSQTEPSPMSKQPVAEKLITQKTKVHKETGAPYKPAMKYLYGFMGLIGGNFIFAVLFSWWNLEDQNSIWDTIWVSVLWVVIVIGCARGASESYTDNFE